MEHRPDPQLTFAQARYANTSHPATATFPAGCDLFASLSKGDSIARNALQVAVPTLSVVLVVLWVARLIVHCVQTRRMQHMAQKWSSLPNIVEAQAMAESLRQSRLRKRAQHQPLSSPTDSNRSFCCTGSHSDDTEARTCTICFSSCIDHPVELLPCGHQQFCARCVVQLWEYSGVYRQLRCPLCRQPVELMCPVHVEGSQPSIDDVLLLQKYNGGFCGGKQHALLDQWVLCLRAVTNARFLPIVIGLRIVMLHATMFTYMFLPEHDALTAMSQQHTEKAAAATASAVGAMYATVAHSLMAILYFAVMYADDLFVVAFSIILTGSLLQKALFTDLKL